MVSRFSYKGLTIEQTDEMKLRAVPLVQELAKVNKLIDAGRYDHEMSEEEFDQLVDRRDMISSKIGALQMEIMFLKIQNHHN